jgi:hypothetical protein
LIKSKLLELERAYLEQSLLNRPATAATMVSKLKAEVIGESFLDFADKRIKKMVSPSTRKDQASVIKNSGSIEEVRIFISSRSLTTFSLTTKDTFES